jgi:hypothetical protein
MPMKQTFPMMQTMASNFFQIANVFIISNHPIKMNYAMIQYLRNLLKTLYEIHERHCLHKPNELVLIGGGRFEFYIWEDNENDNQSETYTLMFDEIVMKPLLSTWLKNFKFQYMKSPNDFKENATKTYMTL